LAGAIGFQYRGSGGLSFSLLVFSVQFSGSEASHRACSLLKAFN
jgi:hypothetical protein